MNSDLTLVPLEKKGGSILSLMGFITPLESVPIPSPLASYGASPLLTGQANPHTKIFGVGANDKNQTNQHSNILQNVRMSENPPSGWRV